MTQVGATLAGVTAVVLATMAGPAQTASPGTPMIIDGGNAESGPRAARLSDAGRENRSATIISPTWILTAEHCVAAGGEPTCTIGDLDQTRGEAATGIAVHTNPSADLALVGSDHAVEATYAPLGPASAVRDGQTVRLYGWGATRTDQPEINCRSRFLKVADTTVTDVDGSDLRGGTAISVGYGDGIAAGGDSGGPMFATSPVDGRYHQVGFASTSDRVRTSDCTGVAAYRSWITEVSGV